MSTLAFLQVDRGPVARSPIATAAAASGAALGVVDGWEVPVGFGDAAAERHAVQETVGFADSSPKGKLELLGPVARLDRPGDDLWVLAPRRALMVCGAERTASVRAALEQTWPGSIVDLTATLAALTIAGPLARDTFARLCALDLRDAVTPVGAVRPGAIARTPGLVRREGEDRWLVLFGAACAEYVWTVVADVVARLGGRPVRAEALDA